MNRAMFEALLLEYSVDYLGPVDPPSSIPGRLISKARRAIGLSSNFHFFSEDRLDRIGANVAMQMKGSKSQLVVFHGFTPWIHTRPQLPYVAWSDCTFSQYIRIYHNISDFRTRDLQRLRDREAKWLRGAERVIFRSRWAASEARLEYELDENKVASVGNFGFITPPSNDSYGGGRDFLMVTTNFRQKGGPIAVEALRKVRLVFPDVKLIIIGATPGRRVLQEPGVVYLGWIDKSNPGDAELLYCQLATARALVHPTNADINPLVLVEAGYFGCPAISARRFAIPELVKHGVSGILLSDTQSADPLSRAMIELLGDDFRYFAMRSEARRHMTEYYTREAFQSRLLAEISATMASRELR